MENEDLKRIITEDVRTECEGANEEDVPFTIVYRNNMQPFIDTGKYNNGLIILWNYTAVDDTLMPGPEELDYMKKVEAALAAVLENDLQAVLTFTFTGLNQREWHWYTTDVEESGKRINEALVEFDELPLELSAEEDPEWTEYFAIVNGGSGEEGPDDGVEEEEEN